MRRPALGFSLIELILVLGIVAVLAIAAFVVFPQVNARRNANELIQDLDVLVVQLRRGAAPAWPDTAIPMRWSLASAGNVPQVEMSFQASGHFEISVCRMLSRESDRWPGLTLNGQALGGLTEEERLVRCGEGAVTFAVPLDPDTAVAAVPSPAAPTEESASADQSVDFYEDTGPVGRDQWNGRAGF